MRPIVSPVFALLATFLVSLGLLLPAVPASAQLIPGLGGGSGESAEAPAEGEATDPVALLLQILRDDAAREELVRQLEEAVAAEGEGDAEQAAAAQEEVRPSIGRRLADMTRGIAENTVSAVGGFWSTLARAPAAVSGFGSDEMGVLLDAFRGLLLVLVSTVAVFVLLRSFAIPVYRRIGERSAERTIVGRIVPFLAAALMDFAIVLAAWAIGYAAALLVFGEIGRIELHQTLYLNAFLAVETLKAVLRMILSPSTRHLRPLALTNWAAARVYRTARIVVSLVGYGLLLVLPIMTDNAGYFGGRSAMVLIWLLAILYLAVTVIWYRKPVAAWLLSQAGSLTSTTPAGDQPDPELEAEVEGETPADPVQDPAADPATRRRRLFLPLAQTWHWLALAWLLWLLVTVLGRSPDAVSDVLVASGKVALVFLVGFAVAGLLGRAVERGITLPHGVTARVPLLEARLNRYVPKIMLATRLVILVLVVIFAFDTLNVLNARGFLESQAGLHATGVIFSVGVILLVAFLVWLAMTSWVDYRLNPSHGSVPTAREETLLTLLKNAATIAVLILTLMFALSEIGLNIGPLLASAGVVGLAIGFGAQKMVQDIITGVFIQFENAINVGDVVTAGGVTGVVEKLTVRSVSLRDLDGVFHIIPFSSVDLVSNFMRDFSFFVMDMGVAYRESVDEVKQAMHDAFELLRADSEQGAFILEDLEWFGVNGFGDNAVVVRARIKTWPGKQWGVGRAYNEVVKRVFDERDIEIPFPQQTVWFGQDKTGEAPPMRVTGRMETGSDRAPATPAPESGATPHMTEPTQDAPPDSD